MSIDNKTTSTTTNTVTLKVTKAMRHTEIRGILIQQPDTWYILKIPLRMTIKKWCKADLTKSSLLSWVSPFSSYSLPNRFTTNDTQAGHRWDLKNTTFWFYVAINEYVALLLLLFLLLFRCVTRLNTTCSPMCLRAYKLHSTSVSMLVSSTIMHHKILLLVPDGSCKSGF